MPLLTLGALWKRRRDDGTVTITGQVEGNLVLMHGTRIVLVTNESDNDRAPTHRLLYDPAPETEENNGGGRGRSSNGGGQQAPRGQGNGNGNGGGGGNGGARGQQQPAGRAPQTEYQDDGSDPFA